MKLAELIDKLQKLKDKFDEDQEVEVYDIYHGSWYEIDIKYNDDTLEIMIDTE